MLFKRIVAANRYPSLDVSLISTGTSVKNFGMCLRAIRTITMKINPSRADVKTDIITANFAAFGRPAPSSLDTRTLQSAKQVWINFDLRGRNSVFLIIYDN